MSELDYLTVTQSAELVGVQPATIRKWKQRGYLRPIDNTEPLLFAVDDVTECAVKRRTQREHDAFKQAQTRFHEAIEQHGL